LTSGYSRFGNTKWHHQERFFTDC